MERLPIWLSAVGERTAGPGTADMNRFPLNGMRQLRLPMALIERPVQGHSNEEGTGAPQHLPYVSLRGAKRRGALSAKREEVPLGCNLGKAVPFSPLVPLLSDRILRDSHVASLLGMTNLRASRHRMRIADIASLHGGHGPPCRLTFGLCHYGIGSSAPGAACRSPAMRHRQSADQDTVAGSYSDAERLSDSSTRAWR